MPSTTPLRIKTTAIQAPRADGSNTVDILRQLKETTEVAQRLRGDPNDSFVTLGELVAAGIARSVNGTVQPPGLYVAYSPTSLTATAVVGGIAFSWGVPANVVSGVQYQLIEYTANTPYTSGTVVWAGTAQNATLHKTDLTTRYYWVRTVLPDGQYSEPYPPVGSAGIAGTAGVSFQGAYNALTVYGPGDETTSAGNYYLYINQTPTSGNAPPNATYWQLVGPGSLDNIVDGVTYARTLGSTLSSGVPTKTGAGAAFPIKGVGDAQTISLDTEVRDGASYGRVRLIALTGGQPDLSLSGILNRNLANIADSAGRYAVVNAGGMNGASAVDSGNNPRIDLAQAFHLNKNRSSLAIGGDTTNVVENPDFLNGSSAGWILGPGVNVMAAASAPANCPAAYCLQVPTGNAGAHINSYASATPASLLKVFPGQRVRMSLQYATDAAFNGAMIAGMQWFAPNGTTVITWTHAFQFNQGPSQGWQRAVWYEQAPIGAAYGRPWLSNFSPTTGAGACYYTDFTCGAGSGGTNLSEDALQVFCPVETLTTVNVAGGPGVSPQGWVQAPINVRATSIGQPLPWQIEFDVVMNGGILDLFCQVSGVWGNGYVFRIDCRSGYLLGTIFSSTANAWTGISNGVRAINSAAVTGRLTVRCVFQTGGLMEIWVNGLMYSNAQDATYTLNGSMYMAYEVVANPQIGPSISANFSADNVQEGLTWGRLRTAYKDTSGRVSTSQGGLGPQGSVVTGSITVVLSYASTDNSITISWTAGTVYRMDGTTAAIGAGSQLITGLAASTTCYAAPYFDEPTGSIMLVTGYTGAIGTPAVLYPAESLALSAQANLQSRQSLGWLPCATAATGGEVGGNGSSGCCLNSRQPIELECGITVYAEELKMGDLLPSPTGQVEVRAIRHEPWREWHVVEFSDGTVITCAPDHRFVTPDDVQLHVRDMKISDIVRAKDRYVGVVAIRLVEALDTKVSIEVADPHVYFVKGILSHNKSLC